MKNNVSTPSRLTAFSKFLIVLLLMVAVFFTIKMCGYGSPVVISEPATTWTPLGVLMFVLLLFGSDISYVIRSIFSKTTTKGGSAENAQSRYQFNEKTADGQTTLTFTNLSKDVELFTNIPPGSDRKVEICIHSGNGQATVIYEKVYASDKITSTSVSGNTVIIYHTV